MTENDMKKSKLSKSTKTYIRRQKAEIRQEFSDPKVVEQKINEVYNKFVKS